MEINWGADNRFIFDSWATKEEQHFLFGCVVLLNYLYAVAFSAFRGKGRSLADSRLGFFLYSVVLAFGSCALMMLMMTMSGWVNIALLLGLTTGYYIFYSEDELRKKCQEDCEPAVPL